MNPKQRLERLDQIFSALSHPARRQILMAVHFRSNGMTAGEIAGRFSHAWATTTGHIRILEAAGLLQQQKAGRKRIYQVNPKDLVLLEDWIHWFKLDQKAAEEEAIKRTDAFEASLKA